jgi:hypothetical protein
MGSSTNWGVKEMNECKYMVVAMFE